MSDLTARGSSNLIFLKFWFGDDPRANSKLFKSLWLGKTENWLRLHFLSLVCMFIISFLLFLKVKWNAFYFFPVSVSEVQILSMLLLPTRIRSPNATDTPWLSTGLCPILTWKHKLKLHLTHLSSGTSELSHTTHCRASVVGLHDRTANWELGLTVTVQILGNIAGHIASQPGKRSIFEVWLQLNTYLCSIIKSKNFNSNNSKLKTTDII